MFYKGPIQSYSLELCTVKPHYETGRLLNISSLISERHKQEAHKNENREC